MKALIISSLLFGLLAGCSKKNTHDVHPDPSSWFIEAYNNGVITVQHEGNTYKAKCDISRSFGNAPSVTDEKNVVVFPTCDMVVKLTLVGTNVQPFQGRQKDAEGRIITMWNVGRTLALQRLPDEHTPWRLDEFVITSVTKEPKGETP